jgi:FkbM family methyltransferase
MRTTKMIKVGMSFGKIDIDELVKITHDLSLMNDSSPKWDKDAVTWNHIGKDSVVVDIGGYTGRWSYQMARKYNPNLFIFEPQSWCCFVLEKLLREYNATICNYALGLRTGEFSVYHYETDGCSFKEIIAGETRKASHKLSMREISNEFKDMGLSHIDLLHMNAEGIEFDLIPYMFSNNIFPDVLMFQLHEADRIDKLYSLVQEYYTNLFEYGTRLSAWKLKENNE